MFQNAFAGFKAQIQTVEAGVALFQFVDHAQALQVVFKPPIRRHAFVERILSCVTKRCVPQIVRQGNGFHQVFVQMQGACDGTPQLRHLQRVRHAGAKQIAFVVQKDLRLVDQTPESR